MREDRTWPGVTTQSIFDWKRRSELQLRSGQGWCKIQPRVESNSKATIPFPGDWKVLILQCSPVLWRFHPRCFQACEKMWLGQLRTCFYVMRKDEHDVDAASDGTCGHRMVASHHDDLIRRCKMRGKCAAEQQQQDMRNWKSVRIEECSNLMFQVTLIPASWQVLTASATPGRGGSIREMRPQKVNPFNASKLKQFFANKRDIVWQDKNSRTSQQTTIMVEQLQMHSPEVGKFGVRPSVSNTKPSGNDALGSSSSAKARTRSPGAR